MKNILLTLLAALALVHVPAICSPVALAYTRVNQKRATNTCADPTLADVYVVGYNPSKSWHLLRPRWDFILDSSANGVGWTIQGPAFLAWQTAQQFTVGLWELGSLSTQDIMFLPEINGAIPALSGWAASRITGYVYLTQICGSVPLLGVFNEAVSDHYYTTSVSEYDALISAGWTDSPTNAFVLPIPSDGAWSLN